MQPTIEILDRIRKNSRDNKEEIFTRLYRYLLRPCLLYTSIQENPAQLNKEESSNYPSKTDLSITQGSSPIPSSPPAPGERTGQDGMRKRESYRALILENIEYDVLSQNVQLDKDRLDELVELMVDTVCSNREMIRVAGDDYPAAVSYTHLYSSYLWCVWKLPIS